MSSLSVAVVGGGHLGRIHARLIEEHFPGALVAIVEPAAATQKSLASEFRVPIFADCRPLVGLADAAIIATPTSFHHATGCELLAHGLHLLIEKPIAPTRREADELVALAEKKGRTLQVGHVERFNPVVALAQPHLGTPKYIESRRMSGFSFRSTDIGVVLDLMIHDLDIVLSLVPGKVIEVHALGASVLGGEEDMAQARLTFDSGCVANLTASRTATTPERSMSVFSTQGCVHLDFALRSATIIQPHAGLMDGTLDPLAQSSEQRDYFRDHLFETLLPKQSICVHESNPIRDEHEDFFASIRTGRRPRVSGSDGRNAVALAERILQCIESHCWNGTAMGPVGPQALLRPILLPTPRTAELPKSRRRAG